MLLAGADMRLERVNGGFAVKVPDDVVADLGLSEGDEVHLVRLATAAQGSSGTRQSLVAGLRALRGRLPADYRFDREDANARR